MTIREATRRYEAWLRKQTPLDAKALALKHKKMRKGSFAFLRATFYRWMQVWPATCSDLAPAPKVLAVGDLHVENFGTWRDREGRLVWGINDFDEAFLLPYTIDLVRLATSAVLAADTGQLALKSKDACDAILAGYAQGLKSGGRPFVLAEHHRWLGNIALARLHDPMKFWRELDELPEADKTVPSNMRGPLESLLPEPGMSYRIVRRVTGLGGLGRQRYVAIADWRGGKVAREAKALAPSACVWADNGAKSGSNIYRLILARAVRCSDPLIRLDGGWVVRRLSPNCRRVDLDCLPKRRDEYRMLLSMGWETANIHLGSKHSIPLVSRDLNKRPARWLRQAAKTMVNATRSDWQEWKKN